MKYLKKFESSSNRFPSKEELDDMTYEEVQDFRDGFLYSGTWGEWTNDESDVKKYLSEFEVYQKVRFKQKELDQLDGWKQEVKEWEKQGRDPDDLSYRTKKLITKLDSESMYKMLLDDDIKRVGEFQFIKGMDI